MNRFARVALQLLVGAFALAIFVVIVAMFFIAWWIALLSVAGLLAFAGVRRLLRGRPRRPPPQNGRVIEGEFQVESNGALADARARSETGEPRAPK